MGIGRVHSCHRFRPATLIGVTAMTSAAALAVLPAAMVGLASAAVVRAAVPTAKAPAVNAYVVLGGSPDGQLVPINTETNKPGTPAAAGEAPLFVWIAPNGRT